MAKQKGRTFGGNKKTAPMGRGMATGARGGSIGRAGAIPASRSAVKKGAKGKSAKMPKPIKQVIK